MGEPTPTLIRRRRTPAGSLLYLAKRLEDAVEDGSAQKVAIHVAFALRALAAGAGGE